MKKLPPLYPSISLSIYFSIFLSTHLSIYPSGEETGVEQPGNPREVPERRQFCAHRAKFPPAQANPGRRTQTGKHNQGFFRIVLPYINTNCRVGDA